MDVPKHEVMISADALKKQIAKTKRCFRSENNVYATGYISALSVVEGMIAYLTDPEDKTMNHIPGAYLDKEESGLLEE